MTSTLAVYELEAERAGRSTRARRVFPGHGMPSRILRARTHANDSVALRNLRKAMDFERAFVKAGGLLAAGSDPCCASAIAGYADQRNYELLVEAGFTPEEAIRIMTLNGAKVLGRADRVGSIAPGKQADLVIVRGDPTRQSSDIRNVVTVFRKGLGYDAAKLTASIAGQVRGGTIAVRSASHSSSHHWCCDAKTTDAVAGGCSDHRAKGSAFRRRWPSAPTTSNL